MRSARCNRVFDAMWRTAPTAFGGRCITRSRIFAELSGSLVGTHLFVIHRRHIDVDVDAIHGVPEISKCSAGSSVVCTGIRDLRSLWNPHGQGFIAAANMNRAGKVSDMDGPGNADRPILERLAQTSSTFRGNSGSSSRKSKPL